MRWVMWEITAHIRIVHQFQCCFQFIWHKRICSTSEHIIWFLKQCKLSLVTPLCSCFFLIYRYDCKYFIKFGFCARISKISSQQPYLFLALWVHSCMGKFPFKAWHVNKYHVTHAEQARDVSPACWIVSAPLVDISPSYLCTVPPLL